MATSTTEPVDDRISCKILIIGAGMAGLSAANHLLKNAEPNFLIVEARNRTGGRIVAVNIGNDKAELGANWIHGVLGNPIFEIAMANDLINIVNIPKPHKVVAALEDGKQVPFSVLEEVYEAYGVFLKRCEEYFLCSYSPPEGVDSVGAHIALEIDLYLASQSPEEKKLKQLIFDCLMKRETCISGCDDMSEVDLLEIGSYTELQGGNVTLPKGYSSILEPITQPISNEKILKGHIVTKIRWSGGIETKPKSVENHSVTASKDCSIEVFCENGKIIVAEQLICTLPLGVLKETAGDMFEPQLPSAKMEAIDKLMFGTVNKIILLYERPFLNSDVSEIMLLWNDREYSENDKNDISKTWFRKMYSFSKISDTLILGWVSGKAAEYVETLSTDEVAQACTKVLRKFLNDPFIPAPKECIRTTWHSQKFTRGSYTSMAVGASHTDIEALAEPICDSSKVKIVLAGEHTHPSFYSTVHGAYLSGKTASQIVLESSRWEKPPSVNCENSNDLNSWIEGISLN